MNKYYISINKNEFDVPMVLESFKDDDDQYGFYWQGDNKKWAISDCGTKSEVIRRLQRLICFCEKSIFVCNMNGWDMLRSVEEKEIKIYRELICALENM